MELFDKRFVHFMHDKFLEGQEGFFGDNIDRLIEYVNFNNSCQKGLCTLEGNESTWFPFSCERKLGNYRFFYFDPLYEFKWASNNGKKVQYQMVVGGNWLDVKEDFSWSEDYDYRIVEEEEKEKAEIKRLTWNMLARWLAMGNGQAHSSYLNSDEIITSLNYNPLYDGDALDTSWQVRKWDDTEWHAPTMDYCFPEIDGD